MEDIHIRSQPLDRNAVVSVDNAAMRLCMSAVLIHSIFIRKLPEELENQALAVTITVNGSSFTTKATKAVVEGAEKDLVTGANVKEAIGKHKLFKIRFDGLNLLFPGSRRSTRRDAPPVPDYIANPRELPEGVKIVLHSEDLNHVYGATTCKGSGEPSYLSYPRGEATLNFRVYPCVDGVTMMEPLYNRTHLAKTYLNGQPPAIEGGEAPQEEQATEQAEAPAAEAEVPAAQQEEQAMEQAAEAVAEEQAPLEEEVVPTYQEAVAAVEDPVPDTPAAAAAAAEDDAAAAKSRSNSSSSAASASSSTKESISAAAKVAEHVAALQQMYAHCSPDPLTAAMRAIVPCYNVPQMDVAFGMYDAEQKGVLSRTQLIHFCRAHQAYADCWPDDEELLKSLAPYIPLSALQREAAAAAVVSADASATEPVAMEEVEDSEGTAEVAAVAPPRVNVEYLYYHPSNPDAPIEINKKLFYLIAYRLARA